MVRSRSETNLNRIFIDLCTSPNVRRKFDGQVKNRTKVHSQLPTLQPIRSNSCSKIDDFSTAILPPLSVQSAQEDENVLQPVKFQLTPLTRTNLPYNTLPSTTTPTSAFLFQSTQDVLPITTHSISVSQPTRFELAGSSNISLESQSTTRSLPPIESANGFEKTTASSGNDSLAFLQKFTINHVLKSSSQAQATNDSNNKSEALEMQSSAPTEKPEQVSTLSEEEILAGNHGFDAESLNNSQTWSYTGRETNKLQHISQQSPSDEIVALPYNGSVSNKDNGYASNAYNISSALPRPTTINSLSDAFSTLSHQTSHMDDYELDKSRRSRPFMNSFRRFSFLRRKKTPKIDQPNEETGMSPSEISTRANTIPHSFSAEPCSPTSPPNFHANTSFSRSFRNMFRSGKKKSRLDTSNVTHDSIDIPSTSTPTPVKRSFFSRFKLRKKQPSNFSTNSLTSDDCTRSESARNTPIRANDGRPVTINKPLVQ